MSDRPKKKIVPNSAKQDDSIMGTNNSSIVSKRSVERLYFPDEPHFFRYFVRKPQRRAPLINRGYWLRMKAIEYIVGQFLQESTGKPKIIINLGCGYDPNPWQYLSRYPAACRNVQFVDVDYMPLMVKKCDIVKSTPELNDMLTHISYPESGHVLLRSDQYVQIGCDLRDLTGFSAALGSVVDLINCAVLFTAEVSITYMSVEAADALLKWTCSIPDARFALLEQILPEGVDHPFAKTMMAHFEKLQTPLRAATAYPATCDQEARFRGAGWPHVWAVNLWKLWASPDFMTPAQRTALDHIEPFDEWEEFALFGSHYFLLYAGNVTGHSSSSNFQSQPSRPASQPSAARMLWEESEKVSGRRRFAAPIALRSSNPQWDLLGNFAGMSLTTRLNSADVYSPGLMDEKLFHCVSPEQSPSARMCHTLTDLGNTGSLLVGGRTSPDTGLADCWLYHKWTNSWERVDDLPEPRYRHSAVGMASESVLIIGGKSDSRTITSECLIWSRRRGWVTCVSSTGAGNLSDQYVVTRDFDTFHSPSTFGACAAIYTDKSSVGGPVDGVLVGGINQDSLVSEQVWSWTLHKIHENQPCIEFKILDGAGPHAGHKLPSSLARFGAFVIKHAGRLLILGGVVRDLILTVDEEILQLEFCGTGASFPRVVVSKVGLEFSGPRPMLIGVSASSVANAVVIMGGGAVCFSFGTYWNSGCFSVTFQVSLEKKTCTRPDSEGWKHSRTIWQSQPRPQNPSSHAIPAIAKHSANPVTVQRVGIAAPADFSKILSAGRPVILEGLDLGRCTRAWSNDYLIDRIGPERKVIVHRAVSQYMDFTSKNFEYVTQTFAEFMAAIEAGEKLYLRSLSADKPSEVPADFRSDFPTIAGDFQLPPELIAVMENAHSSPFRISGRVNMWLHYDVMANILCQVRGSKRLLLFPPSDISSFKFSPGASSSSVDVFGMLYDMELSQIHPHEVTLNPGDVLFLPALWLHAASPTEDVSVAVNVFFRSLESGYAAGKDVYGNRDLQAYERGRQDVARIARSFRNLPDEVRDFYIRRLADELLTRTKS